MPNGLNVNHAKWKKESQLKSMDRYVCPCTYRYVCTWTDMYALPKVSTDFSVGDNINCHSGHEELETMPSTKKDKKKVSNAKERVWDKVT